MKYLFLFIVLTGLGIPITGVAGKNDSIDTLRQPIRRNVIKFNPTPMILWSARNITFSYERILSRRQSLSAELGYLEFPKLVEDTLLNLINIRNGHKWGVNATMEYRFYLTKLNTRPVPAGLYIGPYLTYYRYHFENGIDFIPVSGDSTGMITGNYWSFNLGFELGYQFVFWKRLTLDLVLVGPSVSYYGGKTVITGPLDASQVEDINQELYDKLIERYPSFQYMSLDQTFEETGKLDILRWGFRYLIQIGIHF